jgi:hypothetical protein
MLQQLVQQVYFILLCGGILQLTLFLPNSMHGALVTCLFTYGFYSQHRLKQKCDPVTEQSRRAGEH